MYTVIRFHIAPELNILSPVVIQLGELIKEKDDKAFSGQFDHCGNRISLEIAKGNDWDVHLNEITSKITQFGKAITFANHNNIEIEIDVAVHASDLADGSVGFTWEFPHSYLKNFAEKKIMLVHTYYDDVERVEVEDD